MLSQTVQLYLHDDLESTGGVLGEGRVDTGEGGLRLDGSVDNGLVLEESNGAVASLVRAVELALEGLLELGGEVGLVGLPESIPELDVLLAEDDDSTRGLGVVRRGDMGDGTLDNLLNLGVRDGGLVAEGVLRATDLELRVNHQSYHLV